MQFTASDFGQAFQSDYERRTLSMKSVEMSHSAAAQYEGRSLGHPDFHGLAIGEQRTIDMACLFLDLDDFTGRTFWDGPEETATLANAVSTAFIETIHAYGGYPLGLRGDGLFAGFGPGSEDVGIVCALMAASVALDGVETEINAFLKRRGMEAVRARAGGDFGPVTFVRSGSRERSEVNQIGFAANFAAKCEKSANAWEVVIGQGMADRISNKALLTAHKDSPKRYTRNYETKRYGFYDYAWRKNLPLAVTTSREIAGTSTSRIKIGGRA